MTTDVSDPPGCVTAYGCVAYLVGIVVFLGCWFYAVDTYGWFLGLAFGWFPSFFIAAIIGFLWPLIAIAIGVLYFLNTR